MLNVTLDSHIDFLIDFVYVVHDSQDLRQCHPDLLLRQFIQAAKRVLNIPPSNQLLEVFL